MSSKKQVAGYILDRRIGRGSYATVWKGHVDGGDEVVAVKVVSRQTVTETAQLRQEVDVLRRITHPNIVRFRDLKKSASHFYLVLEYCAGGDLSQFLRDRGRVQEDYARKLLTQIAAGLCVLHRENVIHRDLKPQNILLSTAGGETVVKIADFGFARALQPQDMAATVCGSPLYMAPEILRHEPYDTRADLWSVGAILFELLLGRPPFTGANPMQLLANIERCDRVSFDASSEVTVSNDGQEFLRSLLARVPAQRLSSREFARHIYVRLSPSPDARDGDGGDPDSADGEWCDANSPTVVARRARSSSGVPAGTASPPAGSTSPALVPSPEMSPRDFNPDPSGNAGGSGGAAGGSGNEAGAPPGESPGGACGGFELTGAEELAAAARAVAATCGSGSRPAGAGGSASAGAGAGKSATATTAAAAALGAVATSAVAATGAVAGPSPTGTDGGVARAATDAAGAGAQATASAGTPGSPSRGPARRSGEELEEYVVLTEGKPSIPRESLADPAAALNSGRGGCAFLNNLRLTANALEQLALRRREQSPLEALALCLRALGLLEKALNVCVADENACRALREAYQRSLGAAEDAAEEVRSTRHGATCGGAEPTFPPARPNRAILDHAVQQARDAAVALSKGREESGWEAYCRERLGLALLLLDLLASDADGEDCSVLSSYTAPISRLMGEIDRLSAASCAASASASAIAGGGGGLARAPAAATAF